ncbi:MAG: aminopeptidase [Planctomycetia bacterium]|nr:aminopeptidase [Planctomycetia bacterium]
MNPETLQNYAKLLVRKGINVQPGQNVVILAELDQPEFVTQCVEECYAAGAAKVVVDWTHLPITRSHSEHRTLEVMSRLEKWEMEKWQWQLETLPAKLYLDSEDPDGLSGIDQDKYTKAQQAIRTAIKPIRDRMENRYAWCIAAVPGKAWAKKMFPHFPAEHATEELWNAILYASRAWGDPIANWDAHNEELISRCSYLNGLGLESLHYTASNGTDFTVGLLEDGRFCGGMEKTLSGVPFNPNIPSEEIFTSPRSGDAEGILYASKPLSWQGEVIDRFWVRFAQGRVVDVGAEKNESLLRQMVSMDAGAAKLGEVALIPHDSPISNSGLLFYNTLFDENASCHVALGKGFSNCLRGYENLTQEQATARGINDSLIHVDFMIGTSDLNILGRTRDGRDVPIFTQGNWAE